MQEALESARQRCAPGSASQFYRFARQVVYADVLSADLGRALLPAFAHLQADAPAAATVELTISLWRGAPDEVRAVQFHEYCVSADARIVGNRSPDWLAMYDRAQHHLIAFVPHTARLSFLERARPFKDLLLLWYADNGYQPIHASMVATSAGDGVLISGPTGSGKSTTALACVRAGFDFLADDCVALGTFENGLVGCSIYSSCLIRPEIVDAQGRQAADDDDPKGRVLLYAAEAFPQRIRRDAAVRALLIPRLGNTEETTLQPLAKREALQKLFPHALMVDPAGAARVDAFVALADVLQNTRCFQLELGRDLSRVPSAVRDALGA